MTPIILKSKRFAIRPYQKKDEEEYLEMVMDKQSIKFMGGATGVIEREREVFNKVFQVYKQKFGKTFWIWGIFKNKILYGHLELKETQYTKENELEIVYMVHPEFRQLGVMTEILDLIRENKSNFCEKIIATVELENEISLNMLRKYGVEKEEKIIDESDSEEFLKLTLV